jgi:hypothetical protein
MKPGKHGEVVLQGSKERLYARVGARLTGNSVLDRIIVAESAEVYAKVYSGEHVWEDMRSFKKAAKEVPTTPRPYDAPASRVTSPNTGRVLKYAEVAIDRDYSEEMLECITAIAGLSIMEAIHNRVRPSVAQKMLDDFALAEPATSSMQKS